MNAARIILDVEATGARLLSLEGGLKLVTRPGTIPPDMVAAIKEFKAEIIELINTRTCLQCVHGGPGGLCWRWTGTPRNPEPVQDSKAGSCQHYRILPPDPPEIMQTKLKAAAAE